MTTHADERRVEAYRYDLPEELIARVPAERRDAARLLVLDVDGGLHDRTFEAFPGLLEPGDLLVINETRVIPARLHGTRARGGRAEVLLLRPRDGDGFDAGAREWFALVRPGKRLTLGARIDFGAAGAEVVAVLPDGPRILRFDAGVDVAELLERHGEVPLPPYVGAGDAARAARYQTVFARVPGSVAAPTASLHFTTGTLAELAARGVEIVSLVLDVGIGTFRPMSGTTIDEHVMHAERYDIPPATAAAIALARAGNRRVVAAGTTVLRALESAALAGAGEVRAGSSTTALFVSPGFDFRVVDALLTNFHLPQSTLLVLVAAFAGRERALAAYRHAIAERYRFFSFGDAMFIACRADRLPRRSREELAPVIDDDVLNLERLVEAYEDDVASIANLLKLARATELRYITALRAALVAHDLKAVSSAAHSIKGSASNIGATNVSAVAARIEDLARRGEWSGIEQLTVDLDGVYAELCVRIDAYADKIR